ncbi:ComEA family DNA-binding protein [Janthinobacterium fluminis]|uniref:Helix-hairpin-helix domain-containing protein n=1 Tax=Janthinobacterium fluminis TaxID=2987524 RepID=A0ABT5JXS5_9BURK|nr:helix-hairpin-helix domain-containing protein [Janthinobacterium fluminis]MDC8757538.1 helix-hairpin-helix domain-containing protein [Janthinobacterium fluminis]
MIKKLLLAVATLIATMGFAFAQVDVNKADQAALDSVKGIGPAKSKQIIDERTKGGEFKDWADFESRVKGIGAKNSVKLSEAGLQVNGQSKAGAAAKPAAAKEAKHAAAAKEAKPAAGKEMKEAAPAAAGKEMKETKPAAGMKKEAKPAAAADAAAKPAVTAEAGKAKKEEAKK